MIQHWNKHKIKKSRHNSVAGCHKLLLYVPWNYWGADMKIFVPERWYGTFKNGIVVNEEESEYVEYFDYVR